MRSRGGTVGVSAALTGAGEGNHRSRERTLVKQCQPTSLPALPLGCPGLSSPRRVPQSPLWSPPRAGSRVCPVPWGTRFPLLSAAPGAGRARCTGRGCCSRLRRGPARPCDPLRRSCAESRPFRSSRAALLTLLVCSCFVDIISLMTGFAVTFCS